MPRTLCYFRTHFDDAANQGVVNKCRAIARAMPVGADVLAFESRGLCMNDKVVLPFTAPKHTAQHLLLYYFKSDAFVARAIDFGQYDTFFVRHMPAHPRFVRLLAHAKRQNPNLRIMVEMPTWPYDAEQKGWKARLIGRIDRVFRGKMARHVDVFVHYGGQTEILGLPAVGITNGIEVECIPFMEKRSTIVGAGPLQLLAVGNWSHWHGLDRLLKGMAAYQEKGGQKTVRLTIVGGGSALPELKKLAISLGIQEVVRFEPPASGTALDVYFATADIAIGSLGLHRIGLAQAAPLKHREYCARGIPFAFSGTDLDFPPELPFWITFPPNDVPIDVQRLVGWVLPESTPREMRAYAEARLSWRAKIERVLSHQTKVA